MKLKLYKTEKFPFLNSPKFLLTLMVIFVLCYRIYVLLQGSQTVLQEKIIEPFTTILTGEGVSSSYYNKAGKLAYKITASKFEEIRDNSDDSRTTNLATVVGNFFGETDSENWEVSADYAVIDETNLIFKGNALLHNNAPENAKALIKSNLIRFNRLENKVYIPEKGFLEYGPVRLEADTITYDLNSNKIDTQGATTTITTGK